MADNDKNGTSLVTGTNKGLLLSWKSVGLLLGTFLLASGSGTIISSSMDFVRTSDFNAYKLHQAADYEKINQRLLEHEAVIKVVSLKLDKLQQGMNWQIARSEAQRVTENIPDPNIRAREYLRLTQLNQNRLEQNTAPCATLRCGD